MAVLPSGCGPVLERRRTSRTTSWPSASRERTRAEPINPVEPVTAMRMRPSSQFLKPCHVGMRLISMTRMHEDNLIIRPAQPEDEGELAVLNRAAWSPLADVSPQPPEEDGVFDERHTPEQYLVALLDGRVVGYVRQVPPAPLASNRHVRQIQGLVVDGTARGRGVGRRLVEAACEAARARARAS